MEKKRDSFGSRFGILVAMSGSAVGLGNIWRFPFLVGENGGAAFILIYILCVVCITLPILFAEMVMGRRAQSNAFRAFPKLSGSNRWKIAGAFMLLAPIVIDSYYSVVGGWSLKYLFHSLTFPYSSQESVDALGSVFSSFISAPVAPVLFHTVFILLTALIVRGGIKGGIERFAKYMMPLLFLIILAIAVRSITLPGAGAGLKYLFKPDFSQVNLSTTVMSALGQAFFSLSLGCGAMMTYASYIDKKENLAGSAVMTATADMVFALIAGCAVMPAVFAFGINPSEGPSLVFQTLPFIFSQMPLGGVIAVFFFLALSVAALTSAIAMFEVIVAFLVEEKHLSRKLAIWLVFGILWFIGIFCALSFGPIRDFRIFGLTVFDFCDKVSSDYLLTLGGLIIVVFVGWKLKKEDFFDEMTNSGALPCSRFLKVVYFFIKVLAPVAVAAIFLNGTLLHL